MNGEMIRLRIKEVAQEKKMSMGKLSRLSSISITTLQHIYKDPSYNMSLYTLDKLAQALGVLPQELFEYDVDPELDSV